MSRASCFILNLLVILALWQSIRNFVIVTLLCHKDMLHEMRGCRSIECPHGDGNPVPCGRVPEQERAAGRAEPSPDSRGRLVPRHIFLAVDNNSRTGNVCRGKVVTGLLSALNTVTGVGSTQVSRHGEAHPATDTCSSNEVWHCNFLGSGSAREKLSGH